LTRKNATKLPLCSFFLEQAARLFNLPLLVVRRSYSPFFDSKSNGFPQNAGSTMGGSLILSNFVESPEPGSYLFPTKR
jgi:hypothetical protein